MRIGVAGLGRMGAAIAARLQEVGHELVVWNRTPEKAEPLLAAGAVLAATPCELAQSAETVITMLFDAPAVEAVYEGPHGLLSADVQGSLFIDMSTVRPAVTRALAEAVHRAGAGFVECPVGGTVGPARSGRLIGLAGGSEADFARAKPVLEQLCRRLEHVGPVGAGAAMKLAINLPLLVYYQALGEANALVRQIGRDPAWLMDLFADSSGGANVLKVRGTNIARALAGDDPGPPGFDVDSIRKDLRTMKEEAEAHGFDLPVTAATLSIYDQAAQEGWGKRDGAWLPAYWARRGDKR